MIDLFEEFIAAIGAATRRDFDRLEHLGVPRDFLWAGPMRFGISPIRTGTATSGEQAIVIPAIPLPCPDDDIGDLVAWRPSRPGEWLWRCGTVPILNPDAILRAEITRQPLVVHSRPLDWLRAGGQGVVILDWRTDLRFHLGSVDRIVTTEDDVSLGEAIERRLRQPIRPMPRIYVRRAA